jgi:hypothetical protein
MSKKTVMEWKPMPNSAGTFLGFATVMYGSLLIRDCPVNRTAGVAARNRNVANAQ